ncbi:hypothetical protein GCM10010340_03680 [Streptomyces griseoloalbus]|nr:hypothetical protein GCM10010340_03680 [Streptomyces albaduncus]
MRGPVVRASGKPQALGEGHAARAAGVADAPLGPAVAVGFAGGDGAALGGAGEALAGQVGASSGQSGAADLSDPEQAVPMTASRAASSSPASGIRPVRRDIGLTSCPVG